MVGEMHIIRDNVLGDCFQTGNESSVDRLMKQISSFMSEISDEFKIVVVDAIRSVDTMCRTEYFSCEKLNIIFT